MRKAKKLRRRSPLDVLARLLVLSYAVVVIVPLYFVVVTALKTPQEITLAPLALPKLPQWQNFANAFAEANLGKAVWNSVYTAVLGVGWLLVNAVVLSFCIHRLRNRKIGTFLYMLVLSGLFLPKVGYVTTIQLYRTLHIYNTPWALIMGNAVGNLPFSVFVIAGFLRTVPRELEEAAQLDGCNDFQTLLHVLVPVIRPALVSVGIFSFTGVWNSALGPLLYIRDKAYRTIPMALLDFKATYSTQYELLFAGMLATGMILVVAYLFCQKYFVEALAGSVKG